MPKERNKADSYREKAYEGDTKAMNNLGVCYERGTGVPKDERKGLKWIRKPPFRDSNLLLTTVRSIGISGIKYKEKSK